MVALSHSVPTSCAFQGGDEGQDCRNGKTLTVRCVRCRF